MSGVRTILSNAAQAFEDGAPITVAFTVGNGPEGDTSGPESPRQRAMALFAQHLYTDPADRRAICHFSREEIMAAFVFALESCPQCGGIIEHTIGCPEMDKPR